MKNVASQIKNGASSLTLNDFNQAIQQNIDGQKLNLLACLDSNQISNYLKSINQGEFVIENTIVETEKEGEDVTKITITGNASVLKVSFEGTFIFTTENKAILADISLNTSDFHWSLAGISYFDLKDPGIKFLIPNSTQRTTGAVKGTIGTGIPLLISIPLSLSSERFLIQGSFEKPYPNIGNFTQLLAGINVTSELPSPLNTFKDIGLKNIDLLYDSQSKEIEYIAATIATNNPWTILDELIIESLAITFILNHPLSSSKSVSYQITGDTKIDNGTLLLTSNYPDFKASLFLSSGSIHVKQLLKKFVPGISVNSAVNHEITGFNCTIDPKSKNYSLFCQVIGDWVFLSLSKPNFTFSMTRINLEVASQQGTPSGRLVGTFHIGDPNAGVNLTMFAGYQNKTWMFRASTGTGQEISITDIITSFLAPFDMGDLPDWVQKNDGGNGTDLVFKNLSFEATIPDEGDKSSYRVAGEVDWKLVFNSFNFSLRAAIDVTFEGGKSSGMITGTRELLGLDFTIGYKFSKTTEENHDLIFLQWEGIDASYTREGSQDKFELTINDMTLGDIITKFMNAITPGFQLVAPWSVLNSINLDGFTITYTRGTEEKLEISYTPTSDINLGFIRIEEIKLIKVKGKVLLSFKGDFLGIPIEPNNETTGKLAKGSDVQDMPAVPGLGSEFFDLRFLGLGQHVVLTQSSSFSGVLDAIDHMGNAFSSTTNNSDNIPIPAGNSGPIAFDQNSDWLIGADFTVAKFYRLAFVFNDPNLYGLLISVDKDAKFLKNLQFEILYKKINDGIGVYDIQLQLPDQFRHIQLGAVSITLPNIGVKIYTNGNFYIDIGWPDSMTDFSRSFTVQVFPFIGSGGFYFGYLSGATATDLPAVQQGVFNPVIETGIALSLGVGKTIDKGILKAGLSLTAVGIFQGTFATFTPNPNTPYKGQTDFYYKFQGTLALVGKIYGEVNFAIISATFDITAYISVSIVIEAYKAIPIHFQAGVSVSLSVRINLGLFKITIHLSFSTAIEASFIIGSDHTQDSLWYKVDHQRSLQQEAFWASEVSSVALNWQPIEVDNGDTYGLNIYFIPHLTVSGESLSVLGGSYTPGAQYVGMLYLDTGSGSPGNFTKSGMEALATGFLYWAISAIVGSGQSSVKLNWLQQQEVNPDQLKMLLCYFQTRPNNEAPFNYKNSTNHDITSFIQSFFKVQVSSIDGSADQDITAAVFPVFPELKLQTEHNGTVGTLIDFDSYSMTGTSDYIADITTLLKALNTDYETNITKSYYTPADCENVTNPDFENQPDLSMATFIFTDFVSLAVRQVLQNALDYMNGQGQSSMKASDLVTGAITSASVSQLSGMASRFMLHGLRLPEPPNANTGEIQPLYVLTGQQFSIPKDIKTEDQYQVNLKNSGAAWINFTNPVDGELQVNISSDDIQRIKDTAGIVLNPSVQAGYPKAIDNQQIVPQNFSLGGNTIWNYPGQFFPGLSIKPTVWIMPRNFMDTLRNNTDNSVQFSLKTIQSDAEKTTKGAITNLQWGTLLTVELQRITAQDLLDTPLADNVYNLVGANDASIDLLEELLKNDDQIISQIQFLMKPDPNKNEKGYNSAENGSLQGAIVKANLSTETNPASDVVFRAAEVEPAYNTLNSPGDFLKLLWECSIVRSGGFYFYYTTAENKGLPSYLFEETGTAQIQILVTYNDFVAKPFINSVVTGDDIDFSKTAVYAQSEQITVKVPLLQPGNVGYELKRDNPGDYDPSGAVPSTAEDQAYLQNQFNLLGTTVPSISGYKNYMPAGPTDPMTEDEILSGQQVDADPTAPWNYAATIPYSKFVQPSGTDPKYPNPYAGIGTNVGMNFNWQDMFGNTPLGNVTALSASMPLLFTDPIIALSQWPSMSTYFLFTTGSSAPILQLSLCFDTSKYNSGDDSARNKAEIDLQTYMQLFYQLSADGIEMNFATTLNGDKKEVFGTPMSIDVNTLVTGLINPIIGYLKAAAAGQSLPDPSGIPTPYDKISSSIDVSSIATYSNTIPLDVSVTISRTENVDPNFEEVKGVASATASLKPQAQSSACGTAAGDELKLKYFASQFETTFANQPTQGILLKVATATDLNQKVQDFPNGTSPLWFVRFDSNGKSGLKYTFDNSRVFYYAPIPLATSLISLTAKIKQYQSGRAYPAGSTVSMSFKGVDLDNWGRQLLEAVDAFLSPGLAMPAFLLDSGEGKSEKDTLLQRVLSAKEAIAEAIEGTIDFIIDRDKTGSNIGNAQEKWKQQMLIELSAAYKLTAAVQTPVSIASSFTGSNDEPPQAPYTPRLYGSMIGTDPTIPDKSAANQYSTEYTLSTSKLPIAAGQSWLTYMFESKDSPEFRSFEFDNMQFQASHLESDIQSIKGIDGYLASTWLTFIIPLESSLGNVGKVTIPVPLRSYPTPPSITDQSSIYPSETVSKITTLQDTRTWDYTYTYVNSVAAQDTIETQVELNVPAVDQNTMMASSVEEMSLDQALAQFIVAYPKISADFKKYLTQLTQEDIKKARGGTSNDRITHSKFALEAFCQIIEQIGRSWANWNQVNPRSPKATIQSEVKEDNAKKPVILKYTVVESGEKESGDLQISISPEDSNQLPLVPVIDINGYNREVVSGKRNSFKYKGTDGKYLSYSNRNVDKNRNVVLQGLDILDTQNAWAGAYLIRNMDLLSDGSGGFLPTNKRFIYQTPLVKFYTKLLTLLDGSPMIDITSIDSNGTANRSLAENMSVLLKALTKGVESCTLSMKLNCEYSYMIPETALPVTVPVLLATPFDLNVVDKGATFARDLATSLQTWLTNKISGTPNGTFLFELNVFSSFDPNVLIFKLPLSLNLQKVSTSS